MFVSLNGYAKILKFSFKGLKILVYENSTVDVNDVVLKIILN